MDLSSYALPLLGGLLVGLSAAVLFVSQRRIAGVSGILGGLVDGRGDGGHRVAFLAGLVGAGVALAFVVPSAFGPSQAPLARLVVGGLLVGFGTRLGNGCTSGHGVCGISRLSPRSFLATCTFVGVGMGTVALVRLALGGAS